MALLAWWSAPEAKLITKFNKYYYRMENRGYTRTFDHIQSHFVHMLQTLPVSSNSEVLITVTTEFRIHPFVRDKSTLHMIYFLR